MSTGRLRPTLSQTDGNLGAILRERLSRFDWSPVETGPTTPGVPDMNYCCDGVEGWVELKRCGISGRVDFRPQQPGWIVRRTAAGGRVHVLVRLEARDNGTDQLWAFRGRDVMRLASHGVRGPEPAGRWDGGPRRWDWAAVRALLLG